MSTPTIFDKKSIIDYVKAELEPTRQDRHATPDMSWVMQMVSDEVVEQTLIHTRGNQAKASRLLGMNRGTYRSKINAIRGRKLWID
ncbi:helix-turn-helix domain-containing protein [Vibrio parahaemolyticus]|nr:helix-turn-helix domain-containing protein [Vibrio parahaemolyticus]MDF5035998.1 helix-turn-helix domain-containing protein [Vibrio parahaemolyticus]MDF5220189.1 helix-turn-helix domain-containing protein [Vibrio parahaemolyticus]MDF5684830.1 helix-turn-helix domain-containing protein [Vibrio parahaemolyticus]